MFYDLNIPYSPNDASLPKTLAFAHELGYNVLALNHSISGKLPAEITCAIPPNIASPSPKMTTLRRVTLTLTEAHPNSRLAQLGKEYDILAVRPVDERTMQLACGSLDVDIISLDMTQRLDYHLMQKYKILSEAVKSGKRFELCYSQGVTGDAQMRKNLIMNATNLIRATRGKGLILSSETKAGAAGLRGPWDVVNLAAVWGLGQERGYEGVGKEPRSVVVAGRLKRTGYRGVVDVVFGGEKAEREVGGEGKGQKGKGGKQQQQQGQKRKAEGEVPAGGEVPLSNRQRKKQAKARAQNGDGEMGNAAGSSAPAASGG